MTVMKEKAPIAANNRGQIFKLSSQKYRTDHETFHHHFAVFPTTNPKSAGVNYANG